MRTKHQLIMDSRSDALARQLLEWDDRPWYIPDETKQVLILEACGKCAICKRYANILHIDHIYPVSRGGKANYDNLQVLCQFCNLSKSDHILDPASYQRGYPIPIYVEPDRRIQTRILDMLEDDRY